MKRTFTEKLIGILILILVAIALICLWLADAANVFVFWEMIIYWIFLCILIYFITQIPTNIKESK